MTDPDEERAPLLPKDPQGCASSLPPLETDESPLSRVFQGLRWAGGALLSLASVPLACLGLGPIVFIPQGHQGAVLRFGKFSHLVGPGTYNQNVGMETFLLKSIQVQMLSIPCQQALTKDNVSLTLDAVVFFAIVHLPKALFAVQDVEQSIVNVAKSAMYALLGEMTLQDLFTHRSQVSQRVKELVGGYAADWGVEVRGIEIRDIHVPPAMQRVMAAVAEAEREGQAKVVSAKADLQASHTFAEAAEVLGRNPVALQLRYFQTLQEMASEKTSTIIVPTEVTSMFRGLAESVSVAAVGARAPP